MCSSSHNSVVVMQLIKDLQYDFPKMRGGGGQRLFGIFQKIHPFCYYHPSLSSVSSWWRGATSIPDDIFRISFRICMFLQLLENLYNFPSSSCRSGGTKEAGRRIRGGFCEGASECKTELCCNCTIMRYLTCDHDILQVIFFHITGDHFLDVWTGKSYFQSGLLVVMQSNICGRIR